MRTMRTMSDQAKLLAKFGKSANGNFCIVDTIGAPHPYTITPNHIRHAQKFGGMLSRACIEDGENGEKSWVRCGHSGCSLSFAEHVTSLVVLCKLEAKEPDSKLDSDGNVKMNVELHKYLMRVVPLIEADIDPETNKARYAGFTFMKA